MDSGGFIREPERFASTKARHNSKNNHEALLQNMSMQVDALLLRGG